MIGMQRTEVNVTENNNVTVCAALMDGTLGRDVLVGVATMTVSSADAATGKVYHLLVNSVCML